MWQVTHQCITNFSACHFVPSRLCTGDLWELFHQKKQKKNNNKRKPLDVGICGIDKNNEALKCSAELWDTTNIQGIIPMRQLFNIWLAIGEEGEMQREDQTSPRATAGQWLLLLTPEGISQRHWYPQVTFIALWQGVNRHTVLRIGVSVSVCCFSVYAMCVSMRC